MELIQLLFDNPSLSVLVIAWPASFIYFMDKIVKSTERREERLIQVNERWATVNDRWVDAMETLTRQIAECERRSRK